MTLAMKVTKFYIKLRKDRKNKMKKNYMFSDSGLKKLIFPLIVEQILLMAVGLADTMMVSKVGETAISGVALVDMINNLIIIILAAISTGGTIVVSQYMGNNNRKKADMSASQLVTLTFLMSIILSILCIFFHKVLLNLLFGSIETEVMDAAIIYFLVSSLSFPFLGLYNSSAALYRVMGKTGITMRISILINILNVIGNAVGVFILKAGVLGVAVPSLVSRMIGALIILILALNPQNSIHIKLKEMIRVDKEIMSKILSVSIPSGIENGLFQMGRILVTSIVAMAGTVHIASNGVANSIDQIAIVVVNAINLAIITVVGQCIGAEDYEQASYYIKKLMKISYIVTAILNIAVLIILPAVLSLYSLSSETLKLTYTLIISHNLMAFLLHPTSFVLANGIRATGDVKYTMYVGIISMLIFRLGTAYLFGVLLGLGVIGVWIAMGMDWTGRSLAFLYRFKSGKWKSYRIV